MFLSTTNIRVRYGETDQMGYLYYGFYAWYYEVGRVEALRELGIIYKDLEQQGCLMVVGKMESKYIRPAQYDDNLTVKTSIESLPKMSVILFKTEIENEQGELLNIGQVRIVCVNASTRQKMAIPNQIIETLKPYFE